jgi:N-carbamoyl-L-amino-acid hydrolase
MSKAILCLILFFSFTETTIVGQSKNIEEQLRVNQDRIEKRIMELAEFGRDSNGHGYRVAFSKGDQEGRAWYMDQLRNAGMKVSIDYAGNIIGKRQGKNPSLKPIAFGSHIDMVPDGGNYDGCVGSISALEVINILNENKIITNHPLQIMIFSDEEGTVIGSSAIAGHLSEQNLQIKSHSGLTIAEGIKAIGGNPEKIKEITGKKGDLTAFLELHIEQGAFLEKDHIQTGVVDGIVGVSHWDVVIEGFANHAGTTPMNMRKDALLAASQFIIAVNEVVRSHEGRQVGTVGKIKAEPGVPNVIPGKVIVSLELRDLSQEKIGMLFSEIKNRADKIAAGSGVKIFFNQTLRTMPALTSDAIKSHIIQSAKLLGLSYQHMPSGAGHDSQEIATFAPIGMIFVPSVGGISHSPKEFTSAIDMANGANVLLQTILAIDNE